MAEAYRAITVRQPWAWAIVAGHKLIENRAASAARWRYRGPLLIHAGSSWSTRGANDWRVRCAWHGDDLTRANPGVSAPGLPKIERIAGYCMDTGRDDHALVFGAVIAIAELVDVHPDAGCCEPWGEHEYRAADGRLEPNPTHLVLENVHPIRPIYTRGRLGLWRPDADLLENVTDELATRRVAG